jgi:hypothetical protein
MTISEKNSWILMHQVIETGEDFEVELVNQQPNADTFWKKMTMQFRGQI